MSNLDQKKLNRDLIIASITSLLNVRYQDTLELMQNLDNRIISGKTHFLDCSFQVINGYKIYVKYLWLLDFDQHKKHQKAIEKNIKKTNPLNIAL